MINKSSIIAAIAIFVVCAILSFFANAGIIWVICWAFHGTWWSWRVCLGIWLLEALLSGIFKAQMGS